MTADAGTWRRVARLDDLVFEPGAVVAVEGREIALFRTSTGLAAIDNSCPHSGAALALGCQEGDHVECPWHGWRFDLHTGACATVAEDSTRSYRVRAVDGTVELLLPDGSDPGR